jgi:hypothetical protein
VLELCANITVANKVVTSEEINFFIFLCYLQRVL